MLITDGFGFEYIPAQILKLKRLNCSSTSLEAAFPTPVIPAALLLPFPSLFYSSFKNCEKKNPSWAVWVLQLTQPRVCFALLVAASQVQRSHFRGDFFVTSRFVASISDRPISHLLRIFNTRHFAVLKSVLLCQLIYIIEQFPMLLTTSLVFNVTINFINDHLYLLLNTNCTAALK